ncbi:type III pantothenate kinase [Flavobacterium sp.]|jgi:type III pantothenate kinase|uniref:type III pantothenate kinase n=1 Tax=Flavobacterium sp. TaxID=239 RepID=UPI0037BFF0D2
MLLAIDVGNTQIKLAVFEENTLVNKKIISFFEWKKEVENTLIFFSEIKNIAVASVGKLQKSDFLGLKEGIEVSFISHESKFPFQNHYETPNTLGIDRMVLTSGAVLQFPNQNRLVIDAGTCITYDFVDENNVYHGGAISPGIRLRYESLNNFTVNLPLLTIDQPKNSIGNSTEQSIHSGVINGITFEIDGFISSILNKNDNFIIILTGGDAEFLAERLKNTIFANSNFLLESLNQTFQYNQQ